MSLKKYVSVIEFAGPSTHPSFKRKIRKMRAHVILHVSEKLITFVIFIDIL
jgi:hypothetical protein